MKYLGRVVSKAGVEADPDKLSAIREWPKPITKKELLSFVAFCSYYRDFILGFSDVVKSLHIEIQS